MLVSSPLYVICDADISRRAGWTLIDFAFACLDGGATLLQVRAKNEPSGRLLDDTLAIVERASTTAQVIVNDRADVALAAGAAGAHIGIGDVPAHALRRVAPAGFIIGASVSGDDEAASCAGADYVGIGPVFPTTTRADATAALGLAEFTRLAQRAGIPAVAIGGINSSNYRQALGAGASGVAVIRAIFAAVDPERAARELSFAIES